MLLNKMDDWTSHQPRRSIGSKAALRHRTCIPRIMLLFTAVSLGGTILIAWRCISPQQMVIRNKIGAEKSDVKVTSHVTAPVSDSTTEKEAHLARPRLSPVVDAKRKVTNTGTPRTNVSISNAGPIEKPTFNYQTWASTHAQCMKDLSKSRDKALCCVKSIRESIPVAITQKDRAASEEAGFGMDFINELPQADMSRFRTCAVVSSASSLKKHKFGEEIDAHDAVFRFNLAPTAGYEDMVGSKTTIRIMNSKVQKSFVNSKSKRIPLESNQTRNVIFIRDSPDESYFSKPNLAANWNKPPQLLVTSYLRLRRMGYHGYMNHPIFAVFAGRTFLKSLGLGYSTATSSGFQGVLMATLLCDYVTSYEVATDDAASRTSTYYFQSEGPRTSRTTPPYHPIRNERIVISTLGKQRPGSWVYDIAVANTTCR